MNALVSIHDLMPETFDAVEAILRRLSELDAPPATLLVVPGRDWSPMQMARLRELAALGHPLAAHGWLHHTRPRRLRHRIHAALISRKVAEHLDLDPPAIVDLMRRSRDWFPAQGLPVPDLYVPPAWALGPVRPRELRPAGFRAVETTRGLLFPFDDRRLNLPLAGFEADTALRETFLRAWNRTQARRADRSGRPLRIAIHPPDPGLRLAGQMDALLRSAARFVDYAALCDG